MALADLIDFRVEFGLGSRPGTGVYGTSEYGDGTYGSSGGEGIQWTDMTQLVQGFTTKTGKSLQQPSLKRFRTGTAIFTMDNTHGVFVPGSPTIPGFLQLRPGRFARILARPISGVVPPSSTPIPDGTTWQDETGRTWTAHGDGLTLEDPGSEAPPWEPIWFGRIDTIDNKHRAADLTALVKCVDDLAWLAINNTVAQTSQGEGETATLRVNRILDNAGYPADRRAIAADPLTIQATTLAQDALSMSQLVADSTGGDFYAKPDGFIRYEPADWMSDTVDYYFGGITGLPVRSVTPAWSVFNIVNELHLSRAGGSEQVATDSTSIVLYGRRTHRRLDLVNDNDTDVQTLAANILNQLSSDRMFLQEASILVQDEASAAFVTGVSIGSLLQITVDTIWGWSNTYQANVIAISDEVMPEGWIMTLGLQDRSNPNDYGPYSRDEFNDAFHLGGEAPAVTF